MTGTADYLNGYRKSLKRGRLFLPAVVHQGDADTPLRAQKNAGEREQTVGMSQILVRGVVAVLDPDDLPSPVVDGQTTITYTGLAETYRIREHREIGDGFIECQLEVL